MKIVVIDGQGGSIGKAIVEQLVKKVNVESIFCPSVRVSEIFSPITLDKSNSSPSFVQIV